MSELSEDNEYFNSLDDFENSIMKDIILESDPSDTSNHVEELMNINVSDGIHPHSSFLEEDLQLFGSDDEYLNGLEQKMDAFLKSGKLNKEESVKATLKETKPPLPPKPWVEKYRPQTVDDVVEQTEIVSVLKQVLAGADLPHFLFYGPPGTGKTSSILAAARQLFGSTFKDRILELNASDDRGIQVIRDKVKRFAQLTASHVRPDGTPCPPYKIIILDEADSMTNAAQSALRRTMEKETKTTRFCLICNYVSSIIEPLTSRCMKFRFKPLGEYVIQTRLQFISNQENVNIEPKALKKLIEMSEGDLRQAITCLQSCARLVGGETITEQDVTELTNIVPEGLIYDIIETCKDNNYKKIENKVQQIIYQAYPSSQILSQMHKMIISSEDFSDHAKALMSEQMAECSARLQGGSSEYTQMLHLTCSIAEIFSKESSVTIQ